jgi:hypothetical protein
MTSRLRASPCTAPRSSIVQDPAKTPARPASSTSLLSPPGSDPSALHGGASPNPNAASRASRRSTGPASSCSAASSSVARGSASASASTVRNRSPSWAVQRRFDEQLSVLRAKLSAARAGASASAASTVPDSANDGAVNARHYHHQHRGGDTSSSTAGGISGPSRVAPPSLPLPPFSAFSPVQVRAAASSMMMTMSPGAAAADASLLSYGPATRLSFQSPLKTSDLRSASPSPAPSYPRAGPSARGDASVLSAHSGAGYRRGASSSPASSRIYSAASPSASLRGGPSRGSVLGGAASVAGSGRSNAPYSSSSSPSVRLVPVPAGLRDVVRAMARGVDPEGDAATAMARARAVDDDGMVAAAAQVGRSGAGSSSESVQVRALRFPASASKTPAKDNAHATPASSRYLPPVVEASFENELDARADGGRAAAEREEQEDEKDVDDGDDLSMKALAREMRARARTEALRRLAMEDEARDRRVRVDHRPAPDHERDADGDDNNDGASVSTTDTDILLAGPEAFARAKRVKAAKRAKAQGASVSSAVQSAQRASTSSVRVADVLAGAEFGFGAGASSSSSASYAAPASPGAQDKSAESETDAIVARVLARYEARISALDVPKKQPAAQAQLSETSASAASTRHPQVPAPSAPTASSAPAATAASRQRPVPHESITRPATEQEEAVWRDDLAVKLDFGPEAEAEADPVLSSSAGPRPRGAGAGDVDEPSSLAASRRPTSAGRAVRFAEEPSLPSSSSKVELPLDHPSVVAHARRGGAASSGGFTGAPGSSWLSGLPPRRRDPEAENSAEEADGAPRPRDVRAMGEEVDVAEALPQFAFSFTHLRGAPAPFDAEAEEANTFYAYVPRQAAEQNDDDGVDEGARAPAPASRPSAPMAAPAPFNSPRAQRRAPGSRLGLERTAADADGAASSSSSRLRWFGRSTPSKVASGPAVAHPAAPTPLPQSVASSLAHVFSSPNGAAASPSSEPASASGHAVSAYDATAAFGWPGYGAPHNRTGSGALPSAWRADGVGTAQSSAVLPPPAPAAHFGPLAASFAARHVQQQEKQQQGSFPADSQAASSPFLGRPAFASFHAGGGLGSPSSPPAPASASSPAPVEAGEVVRNLADMFLAASASPAKPGRDAPSQFDARRGGPGVDEEFGDDFGGLGEPTPVPRAFVVRQALAPTPAPMPASELASGPGASGSQRHSRGIFNSPSLKTRSAPRTAGGVRAPVAWEI